MNWITSLGGPFLCVDRELLPSWRGIDGLSVPSATVASDYERTDHPLLYGAPVELVAGWGIALGQGPHDTTFYRSSAGSLYVMRVIACDLDVDFEEVMRTLSDTVFQDPRERLQFSVSSGEIVIFDSSCPGDQADEELVSERLDPGPYDFLSVLYEPDERASFILHKFVPAAVLHGD